MSFKNVRTEMKFKNAEDVVAGMDALLNKRASLGSENLARLVDVRGLAKVKQALAKAGDKQSVDLLRDIQMELLNRLGMDDSTERAINRLAQVARDGQRWDVALVRNNVFKVANELGLKLPSMMFASAITAGGDFSAAYQRFEAGMRRLGFRPTQQLLSGGSTEDSRGSWEWKNGGARISVSVAVPSTLLFSASDRYELRFLASQNNRVKEKFESKPKTDRGVEKGLNDLLDASREWVSKFSGSKAAGKRVASEDKTAAYDGIYAYNRQSGIEINFSPWTQQIQIGINGNWWTGPVKLGKNVYHHRKERDDEFGQYRPVTVNVEKLGHGLRFAVMGGTADGTGHTFVLGFKGM